MIRSAVLHLPITCIRNINQHRGSAQRSPVAIAEDARSVSGGLYLVQLLDTRLTVCTDPLLGIRGVRGWTLYQLPAISAGMHLHTSLRPRLGLCTRAYCLSSSEKRCAHAATTRRSTSLSAAGSAASNLRSAWTATGHADARSRSQLPSTSAWLSAHAVAIAPVPRSYV